MNWGLGVSNDNNYYFWSPLRQAALYTNHDLLHANDEHLFSQKYSISIKTRLRKVRN